MHDSIQLFASLELTFLGFVVPLIGFLISHYQKGIEKLAEQSKNKRNQIENNIKEQVKKLTSVKKENVKDETIQAIKGSLKMLEKDRREVFRKINRLQPRKEVLKLFLVFFISFIAILFSPLFSTRICFYVAILVMGGLIFVYALWEVFRLFVLLVEVKKIVDDEKETGELESKKLLASISEGINKSGKELLKDVSLSLDGVVIDDKFEDKLIVSDVKEEWKLELKNSEKRTLKNIEVGIIFPQQFIIEESSVYSIYVGGETQVIRYKEDLIHGNTNYFLPTLKVTALQEGKYKIKTFIKGENVEIFYQKFNLIVKKAHL